jgi:hypothetical protein
MRSCYRTKLRPYKDSVEEVWIRWFFLPPGTPFLPFEHRFTSANWLADRELPWPIPGEVQGAPRIWIAGERPEGIPPGEHYCGTPEQWRDGPSIADKDDGPIVIGPGVGCCPTIAGGLAIGGEGIVSGHWPPVAGCGGCSSSPAIWKLTTTGDYADDGCNACNLLNNGEWRLAYLGGCTWGSEFFGPICEAADPVRWVLEIFEGKWTLSLYQGVISDANWDQIELVDWHCMGSNSFINPRWQFNTCASLSAVTLTPDS